MSTPTPPPPPPFRVRRQRLEPFVQEDFVNPHPTQPHPDDYDPTYEHARDVIQSYRRDALAEQRHQWEEDHDDDEQ